jgi:hypothetical protein
VTNCVCKDVDLFAFEYGLCVLSHSDGEGVTWTLQKGSGTRRSVTRVREGPDIKDPRQAQYPPPANAKS